MDGDYKTRYSITGSVAYGDLDNIAKYHTSPNSFIYTENSIPEISFSFRDYFIGTNYSLVNAYYPSDSHSFMTDWHLIGVSDDDSEHIIDSRSGIELCGTGMKMCNKQYIKTYQIKRPRAFKKIILRSKGNSDQRNYLILGYIDFYGVLCSSDKTRACYIPRYGNTCLRKRFGFFHPSIFISIIVFF